MDRIGDTYGALLLGTLFSSLFSGMLLVQCIIYGKVYRQDTVQIKAFVWAIWLLDLLHNITVWSSMWTWFIVDFGSPAELDIIPMGIPFSIIVTAILTIFVHSFFVHRIFTLSQRNWLICAPIILLALLRLGSAFGTAHLMFREPSLHLFKSKYRWIFSVGLGLSSAVDMLITCAMMAILRSSKAKSITLGIVIDSLIVYTLENGAITTAATVVSMICFLTMDNLIFLALYFIIAKLYANSVLAMLNYRKGLRESQDILSIPGFEGVIDLEILNLSHGGFSEERTPNPTTSRLATSATFCDYVNGAKTRDSMPLRAGQSQVAINVGKSVEMRHI